MGADFTLAIAQINVRVGDIAGNAEKILKAYGEGAKLGAELVVFPELSLIGYPPEDLVLMPAFQKDAMHIVAKLAKATARGPAMLVGSLWEEHGHIYNAALLLDGGEIVHAQKKTMLPNYGIFDEKRIFVAGPGPKAVEWRGHKLGILICEDMWAPELSAELKKQGAEIIIAINASPFEVNKLAHRHTAARAAAKASGLPVVYANLVGGQDDIVFDGGSFAVDAEGAVTVQLPEFNEIVSVIPANAGISGDTTNGSRSPHKAGMTVEESLWQAMTLGLRDYVEKNGFSGALLGLSGGIDSALTAAIAVDALGKNRVRGVLLPSPYTSAESTEDAHESARLLGIETMTIAITPGMKVFDEMLSPAFGKSGWMADLATGGNVQARLRGMTLMGLSNRFGGLLLSTSNKSELAVGYSTLYGDSCGGYNVLKDLYKTQVYALADWRNAKARVIPERSITRPPTAELAPGQKDEDQLPPYGLLDKILHHHLEERMAADEIASLGFAHDVVEKIVKMVRASEYKRRQSCPGVKLSSMLFGKDRRYPLTNGWQ